MLLITCCLGQEIHYLLECKKEVDLIDLVLVENLFLKILMVQEPFLGELPFSTEEESSY